MGRMHVQNALELSQGPSVVVATEVSQERLDDLVSSYGPLARERGVELVGLNPMALGPQAFAEKLREIAPSGFDDIINLAPIPKIIEATVPFAGAQAVLNIFAGLSRGTTIQIDLKLFARTHGIRAMGSSGSRIDDMSAILRRAESDQMDTDRSVAAVSGMMGVWQGLKAVFENTYPGKIVIYPQVQDIGLTALNDLSTVDAAVAAQLKDGQRWCVDAEKELLVRHAK
jgi:hypothetical protein